MKNKPRIISAKALAEIEGVIGASRLQEILDANPVSEKLWIGDAYDRAACSAGARWVSEFGDEEEELLGEGDEE